MRFSVVIPTMWYDEKSLRTMVKKYDSCVSITEILVVNNREEGRFELPSTKVRIIGSGENMFVNPSWNLGAQEAREKCLILANDDIIIDQFDELIAKVNSFIAEGMVIGVGHNCYSQYGLHKSELKIEAAGPERQDGFGCFMIMYTEFYQRIPDELKIWYGDDIQFQINFPFVFSGIEVKTKMQLTSSKIKDQLKGINKKEGAFYRDYIKRKKSDKITIALILKYGGDFHFRDADLLAFYLRKFFPRKKEELEIICFSDKATQEYELENLKVIPMPHKQWSGWWSKMNLFSPELDQYRPFLYFDLDTAIVRRWDHIVPSLEYAHNLIMLSDFYRPGLEASGLMWIPTQNDNPKIGKIWNEWISNPREVMNKCRVLGDQRFIRESIGDDLRWQNVRNGITTFKPRNGKRSDKWITNVPYHASIICFHGEPRIYQASKKVGWIYEYVNREFYAK